jgi:DNA-binding response OmpR family regulator
MLALWQTDEFVDDNTLTVNINRLRRTLARAGAPKDVLKTHRGQGYSL